ncbi:MAG: hypothetical protein M1826_001521 [Phylliscum demangeonii]|nr:MAG: hypothetical protein M1826_001521 [Phylliscum demangeonii]
MKSGPFVCAVATLLALALARPVPDRPQPSTHGGLLQDIGVASIFTGVGAWLGASHVSADANRKVAQAQAEKEAALERLKTAEHRAPRGRQSYDLAHEIKKLKLDVPSKEMMLGAAKKDAEAQVAKATNYYEESPPTLKQSYSQISLCWRLELELAVRRSSAKTWPDTLGDDMWAKCMRLSQSPYRKAFRRPALDFKKDGASMQKKLGVFQDSAPGVSTIKRPMAFVHSPAVQRQIHSLHHNLQKISAAGMREVQVLEKFGAREEGALEKAAVGFRAAGLRAGEV